MSTAVILDVDTAVSSTVSLRFDAPYWCGQVSEFDRFNYEGGGVPEEIDEYGLGILRAVFSVEGVAVVSMLEGEHAHRDIRPSGRELLITKAPRYDWSLLIEEVMRELRKELGLSLRLCPSNCAIQEFGVATDPNPQLTTYQSLERQGVTASWSNTSPAGGREREPALW